MINYEIKFYQLLFRPVIIELYSILSYPKQHYKII